MSEFIAEAQVLIRPNTIEFATALRTQLAEAVARVGPVLVPVTAAVSSTGAAAAAAGAAAVAASTAELVAAQEAASRSTLGLTTDEAALTKAFGAEAVILPTVAAETLEVAGAQETLTRTTRHSTLAHSQATRALIAESASLAGLRGATLAASLPFLAASVAAIAFAKSIKTASDETEQINKTIEVFGNSAKQIEDFSKTTARSLGISTDQALESAAVFGNLFRSIQISAPLAADLSQRLVELASDLASFNNASPERTLEALRAGLVGQARPLRVFGIFLSQARAQQEALIETGKKNVKELTNAELVQARFNIILKDSTIAQGDFARTSDRLANQSRILKAQISDLSGSLGRQLLPALTNLVSGANNTIRIFRDLQQVGGNVGEKLPSTTSRFQSFREELARILRPGAEFKAVTGSLADGLDRLAGVEDQASASTARLSDALDAGARSAQTAAFALLQTQKAVQSTVQQLNALEVQNLRIQTNLAPGGRQAEEANLRNQIALDKKAVADSKSGTKARRDALLELKQDQDELARLLEQDAQDAKDRAQKIKDAAAAQKQAAQDAAQAQADATQAFIDSFAGRQQRLQNRLTDAQLFGNAAEQISINKRIVAADKAEINAIKDRIRHLHLHGDALKLALATIKQLNQEIFNTRNAIAQLQAERKQAIIDARQSHLEAQLAIAETTASTKDDVAAQKALIKFDQAQIRRILAIKRRRRLTQEEAAQLDAYRVDLAQRNAELRKTQEEQKKGNETAQAFFKFLQTQAGFAANLLGNLIPGGLTGGLVGGQAGQNAAAAVVRPGDLPREQASGIGFPVQSAAALASSRDRGVRPVQVDTTNQLLRQIVRLLQQQTGRMGHPEARYQKATSNAVLDTEHGHG